MISAKISSQWQQLPSAGGILVPLGQFNGLFRGLFFISNFPLSPCCPTFLHQFVVKKLDVGKRWHLIELFLYISLNKNSTRNHPLSKVLTILVYVALAFSFFLTWHYRKDTEPLYHAFMYSLIILLSSIYPFTQGLSLLVTIIWYYTLPLTQTPNGLVTKV